MKKFPFKTESPFQRNVIPILHNKSKDYPSSLFSPALKTDNPVTKSRRQKESVVNRFENSNRRETDKENLPCNEQQQSCINHSDKAAKFFVMSEEQQVFMYCQKCAIQLASQGFAVEKLQPKPKPKQLKGKRAAEIQNFIGRISKLRSVGQQKLKSVREQKAFIDTHYDQQHSKLKSYYSCLMKLVSAALQKSEGDLEEQRQESLRGFQQQIEHLQQRLNYIKVIRNDIMTTKENIITSVKEEDYRPIIQYYRQCADGFQQQLAKSLQPLVGFLQTEVQLKAQAFSKDLMENYLVRIGLGEEQDQDELQGEDDQEVESKERSELMAHESMLQEQQKKGQYKHHQTSKKESMLLGSAGSLYFSFEGRSLQGQSRQQDSAQSLQN